jgi:hypothetical protein
MLHWNVAVAFASVVMLGAASAAGDGHPLATTQEDTVAQESIEEFDPVAAAREELDGLRKDYKDWVDSNRTMDGYGRLGTPAAGSQRAAQSRPRPEEIGRAFTALAVHCRLWQMWRLTGYCAFDDIPADKLVEKTPSIAARYEAFLQSKAGVPVPVFLREQIPRNIDLLAGEYWWYALNVLWSTIAFDRFNSFIIHSIGEMPFLAEEQRLEIRRLMREWYDRNKEELVWNASFRRFAASGGLLPFLMPRPVLEAAAGPMGGARPRVRTRVGAVASQTKGADE